MSVEEDADGEDVGDFPCLPHLLTFDERFGEVEGGR